MYDVLIIGSGIIGASIFRELTKYNVKVLMVDKENDVSMGTTKANSAIIHAGYDPKEGTLMGKLNVKGNEIIEEICTELNVPFKRNGSLVLAFSEDEMKSIKDLYENGINLGVRDLKIIDKKEVLEKEPNVSDKVLGALYAPTGGIIGPFDYTIALAENGVKNGGDIKLNFEIVKIEKEDKFIVTTTRGEKVGAKYIVNAAGVYGDRVHNLICTESFRIEPRRGQYFVMDKSQGNLFKHTLFQAPSKAGKGILVTPTVHGNLLIGPNAEEIENKEELRTTMEGLEYIKETALRATEKINFRESIRNFSGLRAIPSNGDFIIEENEKVKGFIDAVGMKSPALSSAPAIALKVIDILKNAGLSCEKKKDFKKNRDQIVFMDLSKEEKQELIKREPSYGRIICRCEGITEGEIIDAIHRSFGSITLDGVKRRCRPGMGRCQGGFCGPKVQEIIARELNKDIQDVYQEKEESYILVGKTK